MWKLKRSRLEQITSTVSVVDCLVLFPRISGVKNGLAKGRQGMGKGENRMRSMGQSRGGSEERIGRAGLVCQNKSGRIIGDQRQCVYGVHVARAWC